MASALTFPKDLRKLFSNIFVFKVNKNELETIFEEVIEEPEQSKDKYLTGKCLLTFKK